MGEWLYAVVSIVSAALVIWLMLIGNLKAPKRKG